MPVDTFKKLFEQKYLGKWHKSTLRELPVLSTGSMTGQLTLNKKALQLLDVQSGDYVYIFDMGHFESSVNERFFITKGFLIDQQWHGAKMHDFGRFNHSLIYNAILTKGVVITINNLLMVRKGFFIRHGKEKFKAKSKVRMVLKPYYEVVENMRVDLFTPAPGVSPQAFFLLSDWHIVE